MSLPTESLWRDPLGVCSKEGELGKCPGRFAFFRQSSRERDELISLASAFSNSSRSCWYAGALLGSRRRSPRDAGMVPMPGCTARMSARNAWLAVSRVPVLRRRASMRRLNVSSACGESTSSRFRCVASCRPDRRARPPADGEAGPSAGVCVRVVLSGSGSIARPADAGSRSLASEEVGRLVWSAFAMAVPLRHKPG